MATENLENIAPFNTESNSEVSQLSDISKDPSIHSALKHQKASQAQQTMTIAELSKVQLLQDLPSRVKDDRNLFTGKMEIQILTKRQEKFPYISSALNAQKCLSLIGLRKRSKTIGKSSLPNILAN